MELAEDALLHFLFSDSRHSFEQSPSGLSRRQKVGVVGLKGKGEGGEDGGDGHSRQKKREKRLFLSLTKRQLALKTLFKKLKEKEKEGGRGGEREKGRKKET